MEWTEEMIRQCSKPTGELGRIVGKKMNDDHSGLWEWGLGHISIKEGSEILDVGCGGGKAIKLLSSLTVNGKVFGIDYSNEMVQLSKELNNDSIKNGRVEILHGTVSSLPFEDKIFDLVTAFETYYFWPDLINDLKEIKRVLKPGGTLIMVNESYRHKKFEERNSYIAKLLDMRYDTLEEFYGFLSEGGYTSIKVIDIPEKNWITAIAEKP